MKKEYLISVVLTIYNGERYLEEQLNSIFNQSYQPDEVVILDDCSIDDSVKIVERFINKEKKVNIVFKKNSNNVGWRENFINGFHYASGSVIFCADQDDIWMPDKIEKMMKLFNHYSNINVLACNLEPMYENNSSPIADFYINDYGTERVARVSLIKEGLKVLRPGCTIAFRRSILPIIDKIWEYPLAHDEVIWAIGLVTDSLYIVNETLIRFRRHESNNSPSNAKRVQPRLERAECEYIKVKKMLEISNDIGISNENEKFLIKIEKLEKNRVTVFKKGSFIGGLCLIRYLFLYGSVKSWVVDLICLLRK